MASNACRAAVLVMFAPRSPTVSGLAVKTAIAALRMGAAPSDTVQVLPAFARKE